MNISYLGLQIGLGDALALCGLDAAAVKFFNVLRRSDCPQLLLGVILFSIQKSRNSRVFVLIIVLPKLVSTPIGASVPHMYQRNP